ncbi:monocarboxylate transporter 13-like [Patiria miniata]|uniref:Uncharacterized protein n=1 Tax=Patiria miniata TaxID=46514 RepID=A0A914ADC4_PATMI|nr:monocarboxylate transporter 13-like [Patiria miniata]
MRGKHGQDGFSALPEQRAERQRHRADAPFYPEGGWGYVVVLAAFTALMIQMGLIVSMGVYLEHIEREFELGAGLSGWISSGCFAVLAFVSPLASHVMKRLGCRPTAMLGGAIMCTGFVCGTFANSVVQLFVFADVIGGIGASMCHISGTVVIGQYFNKRYALANGFAYTGQGVGIFMFPPILQALINTYGWRGCMLVQGALSLHISVAAALYRPVKQPSADPIKSASEDSREGVCIHCPNENQNNGGDSVSWSAASEESDNKTDSTAVSASELDSSKPSVPGNSTNSLENVGLETPMILITERLDTEIRPTFSESRMEIPTIVCTSDPDSFPTDSIKGMEFVGSKFHMDNLEEHREHFQPEPQEDTHFLTEFEVKPQMCLSAHLTSSNASLRNVSTVSLASSGIQTVVTKSDECESALEEDGEFGVLGAGARGNSRHKCLVVWRMVRNHPSICFVFLIFLFETFGYGGFFSHVVAKARETGIEEGPATFALSVFGIGSLVGRITNGFILHHGHLTGKGLNALALVTAGVASALTSAVVSQGGLFTAAFFSGLGSGWYLPLQQVLLRDIVGQARLHLAYGYGLLFEGAGSLAGGFVIGSIRDVYDSYEVSFYFLGMVMVLGACVLAVDRYFEKRGLCLGKDRRDWMAYSIDAKKQPITDNFEKATPV